MFHQLKEQHDPHMILHIDYDTLLLGLYRRQGQTYNADYDTVL